jgi:hypothetical protein
VPPGRRAFTQKELQKLFDYLDDLVDREYAAGSKRWLPALRDSIAFKVCYAYGLRRREVTMLDLPADAARASSSTSTARPAAPRTSSTAAADAGRASSKLLSTSCSPTPTPVWWPPSWSRWPRH